MKSNSGQKNLKGTVSILKDNQRIRLRWRDQGERYSLNLFSFSRENLIKARKIAVIIEDDLINSIFDNTLLKYKLLKKDKQQAVITLSPAVSNKINEIKWVELFEKWCSEYRHVDWNKNYHYYSTRLLLTKWGYFTIDETVELFNNAKLAPKSYNHKLMVLTPFFDWLRKRKAVTENPFEDVQKKKAVKKELSDRKPFKEVEISKILAAFRDNTFCHKNNIYKHSDFYPFMYFLFATGCRPAEAIGLRVKHIDFSDKIINIKEVLARVRNKTNHAARIRKGTKNSKIRQLPLDQELSGILLSCIQNKNQDDLVFQTKKGNAIDDRNFTKRILKKVLKELDIEYRILYACRHTFSSRCIAAGMNPVMVAFLMGNNPETALRSYTHLIELPQKLPGIKLETSESNSVL